MQKKLQTYVYVLKHEIFEFSIFLLCFRSKCTYCGGDIEDNYPTGRAKLTNAVLNA
jgi:hypothetical protein